MDKSLREYKDTKFLARLLEICEDRGHKAALRLWWREMLKVRSYPVLKLLNATGNFPRTLIAALYAEHPFHTEQSRGLGRVCAALSGNAKAYDPHFFRLMASGSLDDLAVQLHRTIRRAARDSHPVNYRILLRDLVFWTGDAKLVKLRWAQDFWQCSFGDSEPADATVAVEDGTGGEADEGDVIEDAGHAILNA